MLFMFMLILPALTLQAADLAQALPDEHDPPTQHDAALYLLGVVIPEPSRLA
jgi:hypothetical protein